MKQRMGSGLSGGSCEAALYRMGMTSTVRETLSAFLNIDNMKEKEKQHRSGWKGIRVVSRLTSCSKQGHTGLLRGFIHLGVENLQGWSQSTPWETTSSA